MKDKRKFRTSDFTPKRWTSNFALVIMCLFEQLKFEFGLADQQFYLTVWSHDGWPNVPLIPGRQFQFYGFHFGRTVISLDYSSNLSKHYNFYPDSTELDRLLPILETNKVSFNTLRIGWNREWPSSFAVLSVAKVRVLQIDNVSYLIEKLPLLAGCPITVSPSAVQRE